MYESEYRLALRNSGFDGFRVLLFQQSGGLSQSDAEAGLEMNLDFFLGILNAMQLRRRAERGRLRHPALRSGAGRDRHGARRGHGPHARGLPHHTVRGSSTARLAGYLGGFRDTAEYVGKFVHQMRGDDYTARARTAAATCSTRWKWTACA